MERALIPGRLGKSDAGAYKQAKIICLVVGFGTTGSTFIRGYMSLPTTSSLEKKLAALSWIPNGEVDDTRFEKLYDELAKLTRSEAGLHELLSCGILDALPVRRPPFSK